MRRVRLSMAMSLDGYIAGPNGEYDWIVMDPDIDFGALMGSFDAVLLGRKSYEATRGMGGGGAMPGVQPFVISRTLRQEQCPDATVASDPAQVVAQLRAQRGKDIWLFGGGELFRSMLEAKLVDAIELAVIPVLLGAGIPLLPGGDRHARLQLVEHRVYPRTGTVALTYAPATAKQRRTGDAAAT